MSLTRASRQIVAALGFAAVALGGLPAIEAQRPVDIPLSPTFNGWTENPDGTSTIYFGYINRRAVPVEVPLGNENAIRPGNGDSGQPTYFLPGQHHKAFSITVKGTKPPQDFVWTLAKDGVVQTAVAKLVSIYGIGGSEEEEQDAETPEVSGTPSELTVRLPATLTLTANATYAGERERGEGSGRVVFSKYRGPLGEVKFDPPMVRVSRGSSSQRIETIVTFPGPGRYTLAVAGSNGRRENASHVNVVVTR